MSKGVLYISTGADLVEKARVSAESVRENSPEVPITLITDMDISDDKFDTTISIDDPKHTSQDKVENISKSPYDKTIFLDSDTFVCDKTAITDLFDLLDRFDIAAAHDPGRKLELHYPGAENLPEIDVPDSFPWYNSGVIAFNKSREVLDVLSSWESLHKKHRNKMSGIFDQPALREALFNSEVRIATLPPEYNFRAPFPQKIKDKVRILHGRCSNLPEIANFLEDRTPSASSLAFQPVKISEEIYLLNSFLFGLIKKWNILSSSMKKRGIFSTLKHIVKWVRGSMFWKK